MKQLFLEALEKRIADSELGQEWINDPLINRDIWPLTKIGYSQEECQINGRRNINYKGFLLPWLKLLAKLTTKAGIIQRHSISALSKRVYCLKHLDAFLVLKGYSQPENLSDPLLQQFISERNSKNRHITIAYVAKLWREEQWLELSYTPRKQKQPTPKIETIPEKVLYQIYESLDVLPAPLERLLRLQFGIGCRIGELLRMPRKCLKQEGEQWFLLRWIEKQKHWRFYQIHPLVAELVQAQQRFLNTQFGNDSDFDKLFCKVSAASHDGAIKGRRFEKELVYLPEILTTYIISRWVKDFSKKVNLKDRFGNPFELQTHMLRRTKASIMAYCEVEDEYIAAVLGHSSLDMLPHYRRRSIERLEKEVTAKGYVNMYGQATSFEPRKRRYEKLAELLKVSILLGECHRPAMLGDCQYRYACLSCDHHRVTLEDKPQIETDIKRLQQDLEQAQAVGQERRVAEINRLLGLLKTRLQGLEKLENLKKDKI